MAASDPDETDSVTGYAIAGGADEAQFCLTDAGDLGFTSAPDFEAPVDVEGPGTKGLRQ